MKYCGALYILYTTIRHGLYYTKNKVAEELQLLLNQFLCTSDAFLWTRVFMKTNCCTVSYFIFLVVVFTPPPSNQPDISSISCTYHFQSVFTYLFTLVCSVPLETVVSLCFIVCDLFYCFVKTFENNVMLFH